jgi:hypothetical protein
VQQKVFFARHVHDWDCDEIIGSTIKYLYEKQAIAIHFNGILSWDPEDYKENKQGPSNIKYMNDCNENPDNIIVAYYKFENQYKVLIGNPKRHSKCFIDEFLSQNINSPPLKILFLENVLEVTVEEFPFPYLLAPQQGTFIHWKQGEKPVNAFLKNIKYDTSDPDFYLPWTLEIICEEWLRKKSLISHKLFKTGGYLKSFDVVGVNNKNELIIAQVKHTASKNDIKIFEEIIKKFSNAEFYFFLKNIDVCQSNRNYTVVSITEVIDSFSNEVDYLERLIKLKF